LDADDTNEQIIGHLVSVAALVARQEGIADDGYRLVINQGRNGGQSVFHLHVHLLAGRRMTWPPG
jgi:histidine triad (HIT) family protein